MAKNFIDMMVGYKRLDPYPLTNDQVFASLDEAKTFAAGATSYVGQTFSVIIDGEPIVHVVKSDKSIEPAGSAEKVWLGI